MRCLVTGADGLVGSHLVDALIKRGCDVTALDKSFALTRFVSGGKLTVHIGDITELSSVRNAFDGIDIVFHQAAKRSVPLSFEEPHATFQANTYGTAVVLECTRLANCSRFVFASSSSVYGDAADLPVSEQFPMLPKSPYAASKVAAEQIVKSYHDDYGLATVVLRYFNIYGARRDLTSPFVEVIPRFIGLMAAGHRPTVYGDGSASRDFVYVEDVVSANILAATSDAAVGKTYNIASGKRYSMMDIIREINTFLGTNLEPEILPARKGDVEHTLADLTLAMRELEYRPAFSLATGLETTARELANRK